MKTVFVVLARTAALDVWAPSHLRFYGVCSTESKAKLRAEEVDGGPLDFSKDPRHVRAFSPRTHETFWIREVEVR